MGAKKQPKKQKLKFSLGASFGRSELQSSWVTRGIHTSWTGPQGFTVLLWSGEPCLSSSAATDICRPSVPFRPCLGASDESWLQWGLIGSGSLSSNFYQYNILDRSPSVAMECGSLVQNGVLALAKVSRPAGGRQRARMQTTESFWSQEPCCRRPQGLYFDCAVSKHPRATIRGLEPRPDIFCVLGL